MKLPLAVSFDPVCWTSNSGVNGRWEVTDNVAVAFNFRSTTFPGGGQIFAQAPAATTIHETTLALPHASFGQWPAVDTDPTSHQIVVAAVLGVYSQFRKANPTGPANIIVPCVHGLLGDIYSLGMDSLANEINQKTPTGVHATVYGGNDPDFVAASLDDQFIAAAKAGAIVIPVGHSLGADWVWEFCQKIAGV
jgi:hypothetical protein